MSGQGMVTSPHAVATQVGVDILAAGGNAIEAALATVAALGVTYPHFCGIGGDAFLIVADAAGQVETISGIGQAAANCEGYAQGIPLRGGRSALTTAGAVDAMGQAHAFSQRQWGGRYRWADLWAPAIALAEKGYALTPSERFWLDFRLPQAAELPAVFAHYGDAHNAAGLLGADALPAVGALRQRPQLAATLRALAEGGPEAFYRGPLAVRLAEGLQSAGSPLTAADLAATRARREVPLQTAYRDGTLVAHQPPTQGVTTLEIMGILERFDLAQIEEGSADYYHLLVEAVKQAFLDRGRYLADPEATEVPVQRLLSDAHLDARAAAIQADVALPWPHDFQTGDTVFVGAVDAQGHAVSMLATVYFDWGSGVLVGDTGVLWHNRGAAFSIDPAHPNHLAPGKRPFHTLNPGMYLREGQPHLVYGTQGADGQPQTLSAVLTRLIDYRMAPLDALARPRFLLGRTFSDPHDTLKLEADVPAAVVAELQRRGHRVGQVPAQSPLMGHPGVIARNLETGGLSGAHDPRSDGRAQAVAAPQH